LTEVTEDKRYKEIAMAKLHLEMNQRLKRRRRIWTPRAAKVEHKSLPALGGAAGFCLALVVPHARTTAPCWQNDNVLVSLGAPPPRKG
jgi:hypothetical protein